MIKLYTDAGLNTNLNLAATSYVIKYNDQIIKHVEQQQPLDNHYLEFLALKLALDDMNRQHINDDILFIHSDSKILTDSIDKLYSKHYQAILDPILESLTKFPSYFVKHISDKDNNTAHSLIHQELIKLRK
ncbi:reverse transcriptase-like protein [Companilactobacillus allii]|uniref:Ribonuclease H n=1 Tax=Companilactobacillus allii TaxID=1847728 RepID=A0A1P8Q4N2_9LACO|nr:reverse transcriptase-like protein [Companilactobacillus allii]APX72822.1 ribonuclease H [Companilactobacillus allii]USQ67608.1 reverse transcriptase-like protein [Companilactobacillus allii]